MAEEPPTEEVVAEDTNPTIASMNDAKDTKAAPDLSIGDANQNIQIQQEVQEDNSNLPATEQEPLISAQEQNESPPYNTAEEEVHKHSHEAEVQEQSPEVEVQEQSPEVAD